MQQGKQQPQHQPADGPAFWNITHDFAPGELESDLSKMFFNQALDLHSENEALKQHVSELESRLRALWDKLEGERKHYMERIRKLEEAGDALSERCEVDIENWYRTKEGKL